MSVSVYINMEMPTHCIDCPFMVSRDNDDCILQSDEDNENFENWEQMKAGCPLVPVPPHGDLIERKAAHDSLLDGMVMTGYQSRALDCISDFYVPTIISAEEGE